MSTSIHKSVVITDTIAANAASGTYYCFHWSKSFRYSVLHLGALIIATGTSDDCVLTIETNEASPTTLATLALGDNPAQYSMFEVRVADANVEQSAATSVRVKYTGTQDAALIVRLQLTVTEGHN